MKSAISRLLLPLLALLPLAACDSVSISTGPTATPTIATRTPTRTVSPTPTRRAAASVRGIVLARPALVSSSGEALPPPSDAWGSDDNAGHAAFANADWSITGPTAGHGSVAADGTFVIDDLPSGEYRLALRRTLDGDLIQFETPFVIATGETRLQIEIDRGMIRTTTDYTDGTGEVREISGPDHSTSTERDGAIVSLGGTGGIWLDPEGDGSFLPESCDEGLWLCGRDTACSEGRSCQCLASCPFCEDCGASICAPPMNGSPYRCGQDGECRNPGDRCVCVSSCPDCDDCAASACVPSCEPAKLDKLVIYGREEIVVGRQTGLRAVAQFDNGASLDVTYQAEWRSSDSSIVTVDAWGVATAVATGVATLTATLGEYTSDPINLTVVERPTVVRVDVQIGPCFYPWGAPTDGPVASPPGLDALPHPYCGDVIRSGATVPLFAWAIYADGSAENVSESATWNVAPAAAGTIREGVFSAGSAGTATINARVGSVSSNDLALRIVDQPTVVSLSIHPSFGTDPLPWLEAVPGGVADDAQIPCIDCGFTVTTLLGDELRFTATARFDTGEWQDVTEQVAWQSSDTDVLPLDNDGHGKTIAAGSTRITATLGNIASNAVELRVVEEATLIDLYIYQEGADRVVEKFGTTHFQANASYDVGFGRSATEQVTWRSSDERIGGFDQPGEFAGRAAGEVEVWAELDGKASNRLRIAVYERSDLSYCDPANINRGEWSDAFNRVILESSCASYEPSDVAEIRFTVTERERPAGVFDPCLDLYVYRGSERIRTIREQGCGEPFLPAGAPGFEDAVLRFQHKAFWDLRDESGSPVAPGDYRVVGRFYLYYDPVVSIPVRVGGTSQAGSERVPCIPNSCGNGCGYVARCGDSNPPKVCPAVCASLCECPAGYGLTDEGNCELCARPCCAPFEVCTDDRPACP